MCLVDERDFIIRGFWLAGTGASLQRTGFSLEAAALDQPQPGFCLFVCVTCVPGAHKGQKRAPDSPGPRIRVVVSHNVGPRD